MSGFTENRPTMLDDDSYVNQTYINELYVCIRCHRGTCIGVVGDGEYFVVDGVLIGCETYEVIFTWFMEQWYLAQQWING